MALAPIAGLLALALVAAVVVSPALGVGMSLWAVPIGGTGLVELGAGRLTVAPVLLAGAAGAVAARMLLGRYRLWWRSLAGLRPVLAPLAAWLGVLAASTWFAPDTARAAIDAARWLEFLLAAALCASLARRRGPGEVLVLAMLSAGAAEAFRGWRTAAPGAGPESFSLAGGGGARAYGSFGQPNPFAAYMNMVWPFGVALVAGWLAWRRPTWPLALAGLLSAATCLCGLLLSWSRGGWVGAAAAALAMAGLWTLAVVRRPRSRRGVAAAWVAMAGGLAIAAVGPATGAPVAVVERAASSLEEGLPSDVTDAEVNHASFATVERIAHWQAALGMWVERPWLGQGPGHYEVAYARHRLPKWEEPLGHAHNIYLQALAETGVLGLAAFATLLLGCWTVAVRAVLWPIGERSRPYGLAAAGVLAAVMAHGLVDNMFVHDMTIQLGAVVGLAASGVLERT